MRPKPPCLGCEMRSIFCHGSCEAYRNFKSETERLKAEKHKNSLIDRYVTEHIRKRFRYYNSTK